MRRIIPELTDKLLNHFEDPNKVSSKDPFPVTNFRELVEHCAKLAFKNKDHLIFYRGQSIDYKNKADNSSFYPTIYRDDYLPIRELNYRFEILEGASKALVNLFEKEKIDGYKELKRRKAVQWSVLQHYEVCRTPLLDFTHSLRVACSFATMDNTDDFGYIFVYGLPYLTNRISVNSEHDLVNVRLLSICPPTALRPYFQEGYLAGTDYITTNYETKTELDFNNRLIAKFQIPNKRSFWSKGFQQIPKKSLYPENDPIFELCRHIKDIVLKELKSGDLGEFLKSWTELQEKLVTLARDNSKRFLSLRESVKSLHESGYLDKQYTSQIDRLRIIRNTLVHYPDKLRANQIQYHLKDLEEMLKELKK